MTFWDWLSDNWGWIFLMLLVFGSAIAKFIVNALEAIFGGRGKNAKIKAENKSLRQQLAAKDEELVRNTNLLEKVSGGRLRVGDVDAAHTAARMARLLDKVQQADTVIPQLNRDLRLLIDVELENYHKPPLINPSQEKRKQ